MSVDGPVASRERACSRMSNNARPTTCSTISPLASRWSERRIAELAADGRSNREIAQTLFISPKTVENHLGRAYTKLGVPGRAELPAALAPGPGRGRDTSC